jgi:sec-independent protein translocase protein TatA
MLIVLVIALMLYGGKLPEVAKTWGKTFAEFRRSLTGIQHDLNDAMYSEPERLEYRDDSCQPHGYDPPAAEVTDGDTTADYYDSDTADTGIAETDESSTAEQELAKDEPND